MHAHQVTSHLIETIAILACKFQDIGLVTQPISRKL